MAKNDLPTEPAELTRQMTKLVNRVQTLLGEGPQGVEVAGREIDEIIGRLDAGIEAERKAMGAVLRRLRSTRLAA